MALVIGRRARRVTRAAGWDHVAWITAANDFGVYDLRYADRGSNVRSKGIDGFTPLGPRLIDARAVDLATVRLRSWVNGDLAQDAWPAQDMLFGFGDIVADLSRLVTLGNPATRSSPARPTGSTVVSPGDVVEVEVSAGENPEQSLGPAAQPDHRGGLPPRPARCHAPAPTPPSALPPSALRAGPPSALRAGPPSALRVGLPLVPGHPTRP